ncbi:asparagine synthase (glutamine-hydrolyzing) [Rhizosaccharibacter radicis]|uniref:asparagine synthase (glutamine-hydrolyzing) n=1 Tax=Rhizosaccharibacter radicis TaxID=2782605 RepID=A0ABT1VY81_9PROT|nr:asparagine synthase (glutamine-hydrolyzing) [Acetobacteraceae bacterium KSS12]
MCGIAGFALASPETGTPVPRNEAITAPATRGGAPDGAVLTSLVRALAHRGPDGAGHTMVGRVALVHTRLAIIDLSGGDQPFFAGPGALVANGEIYNDPQLRASMPDVRFATGSDCEPPLHLWLRDGPGFAAALRGMYAIAIHERGTHELSLSRDPFGIKPLYTAEMENGIAFASEPQALLASGLVRRRLRTAARDELLQLQFTTGRDTIFEGISRVLPGETVRIGNGRVLDRQRLSALPDGPVEPIGEDEALHRLDRALEESVSVHQRSDVPFGMFLSGGIDSAAVLATMARLGNGERVQAFTATFDVPGAADESAAAAELARAAGASHEVLRIDENAVWRHLPDIVASLDDPVADYAVIPTWLLARRARRDVKVILSGEGGDELFGGYGRYRSAMRPWWLGGRPMRRKGIFDGLDILREKPRGWRDGIAATELSPAAGRTRLGGAQASDVAEWLPNDLLLKLDRCLMAHGVEGRTPLLDPALAAAVFRLPDGLKVRKGMGKWLLRRWLERHMPAARPFAPKQGFTVPVGAWIAAKGERLGELVAARPGIAEVARPDRVRALFRDAGGRREQHAAWNLLFYALWHGIHIEGRPPVGDVFETLSA